MTAHRGRRKQADHDAVAQECRSKPGRWVYVNTYATNYVAKAMAVHIKRGTSYHRIISYRPIGHFEGRIEMAEEGWEVWARYNGAG